MPKLFTQGTGLSFMVLNITLYFKIIFYQQKEKMVLRSMAYRVLLRYPSALVSTITKCNPGCYGNSIYGQLDLDCGFDNVTYKTKAIANEDSGFDESKAKLISALNFKSAQDALPFHKLPIKTLLQIQKIIRNDDTKGLCKNRLYYIASRLEVPPSILSEKLAKRHFIYSLSFDWIEKALDVLLEMGVPSNRILRDLWVLKYHHETIRERLQIVKDSGIEKLCPWMVRCTDSILKRFISISQETKNILRESKTKQAYIAKRLCTTVKEIEEICFRFPGLKIIRVTKVKSFLDFLLSEGFEPEDILNKPRVLTSSQKTVKQRIEKLRKLGITTINLNVLCKSKKDFKKYCNSVKSVSQKMTKSKYDDIQCSK